MHRPHHVQSFVDTQASVSVGGNAVQATRPIRRASGVEGLHLSVSSSVKQWWVGIERFQASLITLHFTGYGVASHQYRPRGVCGLLHRWCWVVLNSPSHLVSAVCAG